MDDLLKYTENKKFVSWVLNPQGELNAYWEEYIKNNPGEKEQIDKARIIILQFKSKEEKVTEDETGQLFSAIMDGVDKQQELHSIRKMGRASLKYAAALLFFILIGVGFYAYKNRTDFGTVAQNLVSGISYGLDSIQLVFSNGEKMTIGASNPLIEVINEQIIIDRKDTVAVKGVDKQDVGQVVVPLGANATIKFSDGTMVHINAGSQLVYPVVFSETKRQVYIEGEGFFEVAHNNNWPFVASTRNFEVEVLGTKFNLSAYPSEPTVETYLVEGKIKVKETGPKLVRNEKMLHPLQKAVAKGPGSEIEISDVSDADYASWYKGYLSFKSENIASVVKKIERNFNIQIKLNNPQLGEKLVSGKLRLADEDADTVVQILANTASLRMEKIDESIYVLK